jgi:predicted lipid-binding transport protein (Tim44 family)
LQVIELIILAALAAVVLYQLYAVLGRRVGRGPESVAPQQAAPPAQDVTRLANPALDAGLPADGLAAMRMRDPAFDPSRFLQGARSAYQMIVKAFAEGDRNALRPLLSEQVMTGFDAAISEREGKGCTESVEFLQTPRSDLDSIEVKGDFARASVRFLAELRTRSKSPEGEAVDDRRTAEIWTFERNLKSRDPNWTLIHVDAAEA